MKNDISIDPGFIPNYNRSKCSFSLKLSLKSWYFV